MRHSTGVRLQLLGSALALGLFALLLVIVLSGPVVRAKVTGQTWYVDGSCVICGTGTLGGPFRTINEALAVAGSGDTILIAQGTYTENLSIDTEIELVGGYTTTIPAWTRDIARYETVITSGDPTVTGDWNGDWLGSLSVIRDGADYRMWYSGGNEIDGESIGYADSPDGVNWFNPLGDSLLQAGPPGEWDGAGVAEPAILATGGGFRMWYVGLDVDGDRAIGYATSSDGLTWQKHDGNPVLRPDSADDASFGCPVVVWDGLDDYKMWYSGGESIWLATSLDGLNWTKHLTTPVLAPGPVGAWDDDQVYAPQVIANPGGYEMWYTGEGTATSEPAIGHAWSEDGLIWMKSPDNPVLTSTTGTWDEAGVACPAVIREGTTDYRMWYQGEASGGRAFGQAASSDGITWAKYGSNPVLTGGRPTQWGSSVVTLRESSGETVLDGLTIAGGFTRYGGGIYLARAASTIRNCTVIDNIAWVRGGGIYVGGETGVPLIENTVVSSNTADIGAGVFIYNASPTISASLVMHNVAVESGGGTTIWKSSQPTVISTTIATNIAGTGGGIELDSGSDLRVYDSRIDGNIAEDMAGMQVRYGTLAMTNTFVVDNRAIAGGPGAVDFWRSSGRLVNVTVASNSASDGPGGIVFSTDQPDGSLVILNSILAFNARDDIECSGGTCRVTYSDVQEGIAGSGNISANPRFIDRAQGDYHLKGNSPAIDVGTSEGAPAADFEGDPRPIGAVDMGADEFTGDPIEDVVVFLPLLLRNLGSDNGPPY